MRFRNLPLLLLVASLLGCGPFPGVWREQRLPSGKSVLVTSFLLAWGVEHDERTPANDCFALEFVTADPNATAAAQDQEALEVFELIRPVSELWGLDTASIAAFPAVKRKGRYSIFHFTRGTDASWTFRREAAKVFVDD